LGLEPGEESAHMLTAAVRNQTRMCSIGIGWLTTAGQQRYDWKPEAVSFRLFPSGSHKDPKGDGMLGNGNFSILFLLVIQHSIFLYPYLFLSYPTTLGS
jgi:hypothetical protein